MLFISKALLILAKHRLGDRNGGTAFEFVRDLAARLRNRIQLTSDGHRVYLDAVEGAFGSEMDYSMLVKLYGSDRQESETRYSPAECSGCRTIPIIGNPDPKHISTSNAGRNDLANHRPKKPLGCSG